MIVGSPLSPIEDLLRNVLDWLHVTVGLPWAWSIVALTVIVRMVLVPLTVKQIHSMQSLQKHAPEMKEIQKKYKADRQKQQEELMKFYKENQINPLASCLPIVAQLPVFFALYYVLRDLSDHPPGGQAAVESGQFSWLHVVPNITDSITSHWSGYLLIVIYILSQLASTYYMSTTMEKSQRIIMLAMPLVFAVFILHPVGTEVFPTGLLLYWVTTNLWTVGQGLVTRRLVPRTPAPSLKKSSRGGDDFGNGAKRRSAPAPKPAPAAKKASNQPVRRVKRKKKSRR
ncbi:MAG: YidC/Oxa1 family membrane protein insertase [Actinomycetota bacterium]|nr:YidC/Oxa1 family membrane protein insertase [Actinomycetota bacterium]